MKSRVLDGVTPSSHYYYRIDKYEYMPSDSEIIYKESILINE